MERKVFNDLLKRIATDESPQICNLEDIENCIAKKFERRVYENDELLGKRYKMIKKIFWFTPFFRKYYSHHYASSQILSLDLQRTVKKIRNEIILDVRNNKEAYLEVFDMLDEESKIIFSDLITMKYTGNFRYGHKHYYTDDQYFDERIIMPLNPNIIDCGGYVGDTMLQFVKHNIIPNSYYIYELEDKNFNKLIGNAELMKQYGTIVKANKKGVWSESKTLYFVSDRDSSRIVDYATEDYINVVSLDNDIDDKIDIIKMDIEGSESEALSGAKFIISRDKPLLEICIYHKIDDFWRIPLQIKKICPIYNNWIIRHYSDNYNETVLYVFYTDN